MAGNKLSGAQREALKSWLCEGLDNNAVLERMQAEFGFIVSRQNIDGYRDRHADIVAEAEAACYIRVVQQGLTRRSERVQKLAAEATRAYNGLQAFKPGQAGWAQACAEWRALLRDIREEMDGLTHHIEISGEVADVSARELIAGMLAGMRARTDAAADTPDDDGAAV